MSAATNHGRPTQTWREKALGVDLASGLIGFGIAAGGSDVCEVTITVKNADGDALNGERLLRVWLSDAAAGADTGTTASGTVTAKSSSGTVIHTDTSKKHMHVKTLPNGTFILEITDSAKSAFYVNVAPYGLGDGAIYSSRVLATGDFG